MKILLTGASGQLGRELVPVLSKLGALVCVDRVAGIEGAIQQDISDLRRLQTLLDEQKPDIIVNAAAYTAVEQAESERHQAFHLNAEVPDRLAHWCKSHDKFLLHYSTDYVFSGETTTPYAENAKPRPLSVYGESKLAGERAINAQRCRHIVLRTSWVYSSHGTNFVLKMLALAREKSELSIVCDQTGCPTWARNLAGATGRVLAQSTGGQSAPQYPETYHYCDSSVTTWYDFARLIFKQAADQQLIPEIPHLKPIPSEAFPQLARRPAYSVLDTSSIRRTFGIAPRGLEESLRDCLQEIALSTH